MLGKRCTLFSGNRTIVLFQLIDLGKSSVSANKTGMEPAASDSQKRIEFGPEPEGQRLNRLSSKVRL